MIRLVQLTHPRFGRRVASVAGDKLELLLDGIDSIYRLAEMALASKRSLAKFVASLPRAESLGYDAVYHGKSDWSLLPAFDHPDEPARCLVTGTGLTHKKSAATRQAMHTDPKAPMSDSMKMYLSGVEGGHPKRGKIGSCPEWFYKGCGTILRAHGEPLDVPDFALDGGDEAEVAGAYIVDPKGNPRRVGFVLANEFSDHEFEKINYLYLAHSKLRTCSIGPELIVDPEFGDARGTVRILRGRKTVWQKSFATGEKNMSHTVANLEHHHFKYPAHCRPGDAHLYFFGADAFSFGDGVRMQDGDVMEIELAGFGRALKNPIRIDRAKPKLVTVKAV